MLAHFDNGVKGSWNTYLFEKAFERCRYWNGSHQSIVMLLVFFERFSLGGLEKKKWQLNKLRHQISRVLVIYLPPPGAVAKKRKTTSSTKKCCCNLPGLFVALNHKWNPSFNIDRPQPEPFFKEGETTSTIKKCCLTSYPDKQPLKVKPTWRERYHWKTSFKSRVVGQYKLSSLKQWKVSNQESFRK